MSSESEFSIMAKERQVRRVCLMMKRPVPARERGRRDRRGIGSYPRLRLLHWPKRASNVVVALLLSQLPVAVKAFDKCSEISFFDNRENRCL